MKILGSRVRQSFSNYLATFLNILQHFRTFQNSRTFQITSDHFKTFLNIKRVNIKRAVEDVPRHFRTIPIFFEYFKTIKTFEIISEHFRIFQNILAYFVLRTAQSTGANYRKTKQFCLIISRAGLDVDSISLPRAPVWTWIS